jgi:RNA polymerase sigma-70 factor (ECF subfamily)
MRAYQDMVFNTAARITGRDGPAEDIAQQVFLKAYENFAQLQASPAAGGWLKTVARNLALNHATRYRRRWRFFSEMRSEDEDDTEMDIPLVLYHFEEMPYEEIAQQLGVSLSKVKIDIMRARATLAKHLAARGLNAECF